MPISCYSAKQKEIMPTTTTGIHNAPPNRRVEDVGNKAMRGSFVGCPFGAVGVILGDFGVVGAETGLLPDVGLEAVVGAGVLLDDPEGVSTGGKVERHSSGMPGQ
jgi:dissimilatory sulfite reductase (desulfoviridin) alpha/beta subunit